jgi:hypothetical protein
MSAPQKVGEITCPSGVLVIVDMGLMELWSGRREPVTVSTADYFVSGKDAAEVARLAGSSNFTFLYDYDPQRIEGIAANVASLAKEHGLEARVEREPRRIPHRERVQRVADLGGGDFRMEGSWVAAVGALPRNPS